MDLLKSLSINEIAAQLISFFLLLFFLRIFAWKKLLKVLDDRRARISSEFKKIEETQRTIEAMRSEYDKKLSDIDAASRAKIQEAIAEGKKISQEIRDNARQEARAILDKAQDNIETELAKAKQELKEKVIDLTIGTAERLLKEKMTGDKDKRLVSDFIDDLEKAQ